MIPATSCPEGLQTCSKVMGVDPESDDCRRWYANLPNDRIRETEARNYCIKYDTYDCRCMNRSIHEDYKKLKRNNPFNDRCWYAPCGDSTHYFIEEALYKNECPSNICQVVFDIYKDRDVDIYKNDIICDISGKGEGLNEFCVSRTSFYLSSIAAVIVLFTLILIKLY